MKRYSIYWTVIVNDNNEVSEKSRSCDVIASNFKNAVEWLTENAKDFKLEFISSVYTYSDVNIAK